MKCFSMKNRAIKVGILIFSLFFAISLCYDFYTKIFCMFDLTCSRTVPTLCHLMLIKGVLIKTKNNYTTKIYLRYGDSTL